MIKWRQLAANTLFWRQYPALLLAISFLLGLSGYLWTLPVFLPILWLSYLFFVGKPFFLRGFSFFLLAWVYSWCLYHTAPHSKDPIPVQGVFRVQSIQPYQSPFQKGFLYKGSLSIPDAILCSFCLYGEKRLQAKDYWIEGTLTERSPFHYSLKLESYEQLLATKSFAEMRYQAKKVFRKFLKNHTSAEAASLLSSLITGDIEERQLRYTFNRAGLQHLLSISGFHFALLILFFSVFLGLFFSGKWKNSFLLLFISLYFLFVGPAPAVFRSFCSASFYLIGKLLQRRPSALNLLGCAMLFELVLDPLASGQIGFQLSFLSCAGLILFFPKFDAFFQTYLPHRDRKTLSKMTKPSIFAYLLTSFLRKSFAVTCSVNTALLPVLLYHFHKFPLLGIIYNLFIPLAMSLAMFFLFTSLLLYPLCPFLGSKLLTITDSWTSYLLDLISYPPLFLDRSLLFNHLSSELCLLYLFCLFLFFIQKSNKLVYT